MSGHVNFRNDFNISFRGILNDFFDLGLGIKCRRSFRIVKVSDTANACQFRIFLNFNPPSVRVGQMPVKLVEFVKSHPVEQLFHLFLSEEMARFVEHQSTPRIARRILNRSLRKANPARCWTGQRHLQQGLKSVEQSGICRSCKLDLPVGNIQPVSFVTFHFLGIQYQNQIGRFFI